MKPSLPLPPANTSPHISSPALSKNELRELRVPNESRGPSRDFAGQLSRAAKKSVADKPERAEPERKAPAPREHAKPDDLAIACNVQAAVLIAPETSAPIEQASASTDAATSVESAGSRADANNHIATQGAQPSRQEKQTSATATPVPQSATSPIDTSEFMSMPSVELAMDARTAKQESPETESSTEENISAQAQTAGKPPVTTVPSSKSRAAKDEFHQPFTLNDQPTSAGIAAAKQQSRMIDAIEMDETAGQIEKNLPGDTFAPGSPAARASVPDDARPSLRRDIEPNPIGLHVASPDFSAQPETKVEIASPSMSDLAVDRVARALLDGLARLRHSDSDSITMTITPQPGTELSLRVEMRDGTISAHLQFERGDRHLVDSNWQELQRRMADQGVQLHRDGKDNGSAEARSNHSFHQNFSQSQSRENASREQFIPQKPPTRDAVPTSNAASRFSRSILERWA